MAHQARSRRAATAACRRAAPAFHLGPRPLGAQRSARVPPVLTLAPQQATQTSPDPLLQRLERRLALGQRQVRAPATAPACRSPPCVGGSSSKVRSVACSFAETTPWDDALAVGRAVAVTPARRRLALPAPFSARLSLAGYPAPRTALARRARRTTKKPARAHRAGFFRISRFRERRFSGRVAASCADTGDARCSPWGTSRG